MNVQFFKILIDLGVHIGHHSDSSTPYSNYYSIGILNKRVIINIYYTINQLKYSLSLLKRIGMLNGHLLFYHSNVPTSSMHYKLFLVQLISVKAKQSFIDTNWQFGQLSNFYSSALEIVDMLNLNIIIEQYKKITIRLIDLVHLIVLYAFNNRINYFGWSFNYTKMLKFWRFLNQFKYYNNFKQYPDILLYIGADNISLPAKEAVNRLIPVVGLLDTNSYQYLTTTYWIPSNDDSLLIGIFYFQLFINSFMIGNFKNYSIWNV